MKKLQTGIIFTLFTVLTIGCEALGDIDQTTALKNVTFSYDSMLYALEIPDGSLSGKSFEELMKLDSAKYGNPANYGVNFYVTMEADNTNEDARDAKFDGMKTDIIMDTLVSAPIETIADPFTVLENTKKNVTADGYINLATHRETGLYIFRQIVDGNDLSTTLASLLYYKFGQLEGNIPLPEIHQDIPTRASEETKEFLRGLLESSAFALPESKD